ncbi:MAG: type II toxin-antitoxin system RelE/ParE family toxin [Beijerinckiaceae bacterium]
MLKVLKTKEFARLARKAKLSDSILCDAIERAERGMVDADLGSEVIKQRIARPNQGRSGRFRAILLYRAGERAIFAFLFAKSDRENLSEIEEEVYRDLAKRVLSLPDAKFKVLIEQRGWQEIDCKKHESEISKRRASRSSPRGRGSSRDRRDR